MLPNEEVTNLLIASGYSHFASQCHYSARALTIIHESAKFFAGFVTTTTSYNEFVPHSFNAIDGNIVDLARLSEDGNTIEVSEFTGFPHTYYGIKVPRNFILQYRDETFCRGYSMNPVIVDYYGSIREYL